MVVAEAVRKDLTLDLVVQAVPQFVGGRPPCGLDLRQNGDIRNEEVSHPGGWLEALQGQRPEAVCGACGSEGRLRGPGVALAGGWPGLGEQDCS